MTDKKKAKELASLLVGEDQNQEPLVEILMEMAQWKEQQMMKNATDADVNTYECVGESSYVEFVANLPVSQFRKDDKVKIIIVKED